jgi:hypothetical protein
LPTLSLVFAFVLKLKQRIQVGIGLQINATTSATIAAAWTAARYELFATECSQSIAAVPGFD